MTHMGGSYEEYIMQLLISEKISVRNEMKL